MTHTFAELELSAAAYDEIAAKLRIAGYDQAFNDDEPGRPIDMHGIGVTRSVEPGGFPMRRMTITIEAPSAGDALLWPIVREAFREYAVLVGAGELGSQAVESFRFTMNDVGEVLVSAVATNV